MFFDGQDAPELVHLAVVAGQFADEEAVESAASGDGQQDAQRGELLRIQCGTDEKVEERAGDERKPEQGGDRS